MPTAIPATIHWLVDLTMSRLSMPSSMVRLV